MNFRPFMFLQVALFTTLIVWNVVGFAYFKPVERHVPLNARGWASDAARK